MNFFFQQKLKVSANNMKKFVPLIILSCLIFYGMFSSYKKKMQRTSDLINQLKLKTFFYNSTYSINNVSFLYEFFKKN